MNTRGGIRSEQPMDLEQRLTEFLSRTPAIDATAFIHQRATVIGAVTIGPLSSVWPGAVLRGDINTISIGEGTNIQDGSVLHLSDDYGVEIGDWCTVGHLAMVHACRIGDCCLIGMHSTILDGAEIGAESIIGAHSLITGNTRIPPGSLVHGAPARVIRPLDDGERSSIRGWADKYVVVAAHHRRIAKD